MNCLPSTAFSLNLKIFLIKIFLPSSSVLPGLCLQALKQQMARQIKKDTNMVEHSTFQTCHVKSVIFGGMGYANILLNSADLVLLI